MAQFKTFVVFSGLLLTALLFQSCSKIQATDISTNDSGLLGAPVDPTNPNPNPNPVPAPIPVAPPTLAEVLKTIQPTLAVRAISCLLCHAQINSSVITDFGFGTANFMGGTKHFYNGQSWYNDLAGTWQSASINGSVYVPDAQVTTQAQAVLGSAYQDLPLVSLADFMKIPFTLTWTDYLQPEDHTSAMANHVTPDAGVEKVIAKSQVVIRAPSVDEIKNLAPHLWATGTDTSEVTRVGPFADVQLVKIGTAGNTYFKNDPAVTLECSKADLVVKGTLLLRNLKVNADGGCRIYVSGSVFIEGAITYEGGGDLQNIQITSSSAIIMGLNKNSVVDRLIDERRGLTIVARDYLALANQVVAEATTIGDLKDAGATSPRTAIDFNGVLLNAPIVHSRYLGNVKGTVIAEAALFAVGNFKFAFDPVFTKVNVLPLLTNPILVAN